MNINGTDVIKHYVRMSLDARLESWDDKESLNFYGIPTTDLQSVLEEYGFQIEEDILDLNGWQADYWMKAKYKGKKYSLSGCFYDGTHCLYLEED